MTSAPMPGTPGEIIRMGNSTFFFDNTGSAWEMIGNYAVPISEDHAHMIAAEIALSEIKGPEPITGMPYIWPGSSAVAQPAPFKRAAVKTTVQERTKALVDVVKDLCRSGDFVKTGNNAYRSKRSQKELCEIWANHLGSDYGTSEKTLRAILKDLGTSVVWERAKWTP